MLELPNDKLKDKIRLATAQAIYDLCRFTPECTRGCLIECEDIHNMCDVCEILYRHRVIINIARGVIDAKTSI